MSWRRPENPNLIIGIRRGIALFDELHMGGNRVESNLDGAFWPTSRRFDAVSNFLPPKMPSKRPMNQQHTQGLGWIPEQSKVRLSH